jgi:hypothetical protein
VLEFTSDDPIAARALEALYHAAPATKEAPTLRYGLARTSTGAYVATGPARPPFGPAALGEAWAFLEWRATEDLLNATSGADIFLHAAAASIGTRLVLIVGDSGAGKSTLVAHLMLRGHRMLGDDLVCFAPNELTFSAVGRSLKLDDNSLRHMPLLASKCAVGTVGTLLAAGCYYVSPAAIRRSWQAAPGNPWAVVLLDGTQHEGPAGIARSSEGEAAVYVTQKVLGGPVPGNEAPGREDVTVRLLESLSEVAAYRASGADPAAVAAALENEALR